MRQTLEMALEALKKARRKILTTEECHAVIMSIKEALAQPEQEPVAWMSKEADIVYTSIQVDGCFQHDHIPLYTTPPQRKPLTDEEMKKIWYDMKSIMGWYSFQEIARAIEAAHGIKE